MTSSLSSRLLFVAASLVTTPITVRYLGNEGYGLMVLMSSVVGWLQFSSLGLGAALQNPLTTARVGHDVQLQRELLSTALLSLMAVASLLLIAGLAAFPAVNWLTLFPPTTERFVSEIPTAIIVVYCGLVGSIVFSVFGPLYAARQESHLGSLPPLGAGVLSIAATMLAVRFDLGLVGIVCASIGPSLFAQTAFAVWTLCFRTDPELCLSLRYWSRDAWGMLRASGSSFVLLQIFTIVFSQADAFIIAHWLNTGAVTPYTVAQKVFLQIGGLFTLVSTAMWSAYGNARAAGDFGWIRRSRRAIQRLFVIFYGLLSVAMVLGGHRILSWWVGEAASPSTVLIAGVASYFFVREWTVLQAILLNGLNVIKPQVWVPASSAILILALELALIDSLGPLGLAVGGAVGFSLVSAWYLPLLAERAIRRMEVERVSFTMRPTGSQ